MDPACVELALTNLSSWCTPVADRAEVVGDIIDFREPLASTAPAMSWEAWVQRLDGRRDPLEFSLDEWYAEWLTLWPIEEVGHLHSLRTFLANERLFAQGAARRPRQIRNWFATHPGLEAACEAYTAVLFPMLDELWTAQGWVGKRISQLTRPQP